MLASDNDVESLKWKTHSNKEYGTSITWYGDSDVTRYMSHTRRVAHDDKRCKGVSVGTASSQLLPVPGRVKRHFLFLNENSTDFVLREVVHVPQLK